MEKKDLLLPVHVVQFAPPSKHTRTLRRWRRSRYYNPSGLRHAARAFLLVLLLFGAIVACSYFSCFSSVIPPIATSTKHYPTDFGLIFGHEYDLRGAEWSEMLPTAQDRWTLQAGGELGSGKEGWAGLALDSVTKETLVVKQIRRIPSVERNQVPLAIKQWLNFSDEESATWPTEIPATLLLSRRLSSSIAAAGGSSLVPLLGYSFARSADSRHSTEPMWHMATPYMARGNLASFAKSFKRTNSTSTVRQLDFRYRPALEKLLLSLAVLGDHGICHDDVKPSNVFVADDRSWHLGDFGQVREASLSYHQSRFWTNGQQLADCTHNDLRRALRSYLEFLREAALPQYKSTFDEELFAARQPWAQLYWEFADSPRSGHELVALSRAIPPHSLATEVPARSRDPGWVPLRFVLGRRHTLRLAARWWELSCKIANPWDLVGHRAWLLWGWRGGARSPLI